MSASATDGQIPATLIPGDGIGPEISEAVVAVLDAMGAPFAWDVQQGGMAGIAACGDPLPPPGVAQKPLVSGNTGARKAPVLRDRISAGLA